jgi:iron complex outermembrane receptor protein
MTLFKLTSGLQRLFGLVLVLPFLLPPVAFAQQGEGDAALEEITVTARKRLEGLQEVALSVSAMGQQDIKIRFASDLRDLIDISPNTVLDDTNQGPGGVAAACIRGIGVSEVEKNFDPAVGIVVDGIFRGTMTGSIERAIDLERMEVLRGPQGTLFGRNTIGGVINMERSKPTMNTDGKVRVSFGNYDSSIIDGILNVGNGESLGLKLSGAYHEQGEGYYSNLITGRDEGRMEYTSAGANLLWAPLEEIELEVTYLTESTEQDSPPLLNVGQSDQLFCIGWGYCSSDGRTPVSGGRYDSLQAYGNDVTNPFPGEPFAPPGYDEPQGPHQTTFDTDTLQLEVHWELNDSYHFDYVGGQWETEETYVNDWDGVSEILFHTDRPAEYSQLTHEMRLTYDAQEALTYTVGMYFWDSDYEIRLRSYIGFAVPGLVLDLPQFTTQTNKSTAWFFEGDYRWDNGWTLNLGGRYTKDKKTSDQFGVVTAFANTDWSEFTPKLAVKKQFENESMVYLLYSKGYRAGGFNGRVDSPETATTPYDPETVDNFELGYRSEWADRTVIFNATVFYMDYQDKQEEIQQPSQTSGTGQVTRVVNAASATIQGLEVEFTWLATEGLTLRGNLGLLDASYDDFLVNTGTSDDPVITDFSSLDFRRAPETNFGLTGNYEFEVGSGSMLLHAGWRYVDSHEVDFANKPELRNEEQHLVNASANHYINSWYFSVFGRNLTDEDGYQIGFDVAGLWSYAAPRAPRTYGVEVGFSFGD